MDSYARHTFSRPVTGTSSPPSPGPACGHKSVPVNAQMLMISEVADLMRISQRTVRRMIKDGILKCHRIGRVVRISRDDLRTCIENLRAQPIGGYIKSAPLGR